MYTEPSFTKLFAPLTPENLRRASTQVERRTLIGKLTLRSIELDEERTEA